MNQVTLEGVGSEELIRVHVVTIHDGTIFIEPEAIPMPKIMVRNFPLRYLPDTLFRLMVDPAQFNSAQATLIIGNYVGAVYNCLLDPDTDDSED